MYLQGKLSGSRPCSLWPFLLVLAINSNGYSSSADGPLEIEQNADDIYESLEFLNGDIFWAPASGFTAQNSWPNVFGDEIRSVFGPIPPISCNTDAGAQLTMESGGNRVHLTRSGYESYVFEHISDSDKVVRASESIKYCDKPSLANTEGHLCGTGSRIAILDNLIGNSIDWVVLCRKGERSWRLTSWDDYWHRDNPLFALLGVVGFNSNSGEVVFIDGTDRKYGGDRIRTFTWAGSYPPPGGMGYEDNQNRSKAHQLYSYSTQIKCETCHDNKEPWIVTPHLKIRGFGYRDRATGEKFGHPNFLPLVQPRSSKSPYRVIGTRYTRKADLTSKTFSDPTGSCSYCHTLTTGWTGKVLAYDAVGKINENQKYKPVFERVLKTRTEWAKQKHNTHPWMVPWLGPNVKSNVETDWVPSAIDDDNWDRIAACINENSTEDCQYRPVYTSCPAPESSQLECSREDENNNDCSRVADPFGPGEMSAVTLPPDDESNAVPQFERKTAINWTYLNGLGAVPQRDDVRFNLAIREVDIPSNAGLPKREDYPSLQAATDPYFSHPQKKGRIHYCDLGARRQKTCHVLNPGRGEFFINNVSYAGHVRNTTPEPAFSPRQYRVVIPTRCNKRYLARLVPKRFCFDRSGVLASSVDHLAYFDVRCNAG